MTNKPISDQEFCQWLNISRSTAYRLRRRGELMYCRMGTKIMYTSKQLEKFLDDHRVECVLESATQIS